MQPIATDAAHYVACVSVCALGARVDCAKWPAYIQNGHKPERPQTKTATKRPQSDTKTTFT